ncbi:MAG: DNA repair protein RadC [Eubacterium sp.]|nr:DNA repair protein RadC [Eubacterium sp.]
MNKIKDLPKNERPSERCLKYGAEVLTDEELLAVILRTGTARMNVKELAAKILSETASDNLLSVMHLKKEQLLRMKGVGQVKTSQLLCIAELVKRISSIQAERKLRLDQPGTIADYYMERMRHLEQEHLLILFLDTKCSLIKEQVLTTGTVNQSLISTRDVFVEALKCNAVHFILLHNHPSGDCTPSKADVSATIRLCEAGKMIGIQCLDHIIIGDQKYISMKELKLID